ncbi:NAD(P)H-binding protein [Rhizobium sp. RU36D]|uniref:NAD(P)H-binding protein n=1 Tax=Rhizobium sp. RU36D TaxID=1907415 RepID=UPI0009D7CC17|nr:NAD(P)H-binding protein [Rhizobium sp. RU36D]SMC43510.1 NAD(P)H dehydrogenase (quinone) [Rhizobium sp. RU36D]
MILITGISGRLGSLIHAGAIARGLAPMAGSSKPQGIGERTRRIDFDDPDSLDLGGVSTLMIVSAGYGEDDVVIGRHERIISAAEQKGVQHIVYTSLAGEGDHLAFALAHRWTERRLQRSSADRTILRNGLYAELIADLSAPVDGIITAPFGTGRISAVARADLAEAAVTVLANPAAHRNRIYELSGTDAWSIGELADAVGVVYRPIGLGAQREHLATLPLLPFQPAMLMSIYSAAAHGFLESHRSDLQALLERPPRPSLAEALKHLGQAR